MCSGGMALWSGMPPSALLPAASTRRRAAVDDRAPRRCRRGCASWAGSASAPSAEEGSVTPCLRKPSIGPRAAMAASIAGIGAGLVGADRDQVGLLLVGRHQLADLVAGRADLGRDDLADQARDARRARRRRVVAGVREVARRGRCGRRGCLGRRRRSARSCRRRRRARCRAPVIEPRGDVPVRSSSFGSIANTRRRVAARGGRLADRQADLALGHREARDRVHHQHHVAALVAEVLRDRGRRERGLQAHERGLVGGRADHDRAREALLAEVALA